jgi:hypothetical protein
MPRSGGGVYSLPAGSIVTDGVDDILAAQHNDPLNDIALDMNTARPVVAGGTGATTKLGAQQALDLEPGVDIQAYDAGLASIAGLTTAADRMIYTTASDVYAVATLTAAGRAILDDADAAAQLVTLGAQPSDPDLTAIAGLASTGMIARTGAGTAAARTITAGAGVTVTNGDGVAGNPTIAAPGARVLLASKTASASATLDFTEMNNTLYSVHFLRLKAVKPTTDSVQLQSRLSSDGGASYLASAGAYRWAMDQMPDGGGSDASNSSSATAVNISTSNAAGVLGNAAGEDGVSGDLYIRNAGSGSLKTVLSFDGSAFDKDGEYAKINGGGTQTTAALTDAIRFLMSSGTIASGTVELWGEV